MEETSLVPYLIYYFILSPIAKIFFVNIHYFTSQQKRNEYLIRKLVKWGNVTDYIHVAVALYFLGFREVTVRIESFGFLGWPFIVHWNTITFVFLSFATIIIGVIGHFSLFYLHRDAYYHKFFSLYFIFHLAIKLIVLSSDTVFFLYGLGIAGLFLSASYCFL